MSNILKSTAKETDEGNAPVRFTQSVICLHIIVCIWELFPHISVVHNSSPQRIYTREFTLYNILVYKPAHCISTETLYRRSRPVFGKFWYYFLGGNKWYKIFKSDADHMLHYTKIQYILNIRLQQLFIVSVHLHIHLPQYGRKLSGKTNLIKIDFSL